jgi:GNAT superfamily N-acetyltransferase
MRVALSHIRPDHIIADLGRADDASEILELNRREYGTHDILATHADFTWRRDQNPAGQAIIPVVRDERDAVIGFIWIVPLRLRIKGQDRLAATGTNLVIHPEYRGTFSYPKLLRRFEQAFIDNNIPLHFSFVSEQTFQRQRKRAPQTVTTIPLLVKALDAKSLAHTYFVKRWQRSIVSQVGQLVLSVLSRRRRITSKQKITIQAIDQFDASFDGFWSKVRDKCAVTNIRDRAFLAWRFANISGRSYCALAAHGHDQMLGYAILRCMTIHNIKVGLVMDLLVTDGALGKAAGTFLMAEAEAYFRMHGMAVAAGLMVPLTSEYEMLRQAGFVSIPSMLTPRRFRFAFFVHDTGEKDLASLSVKDWFVTLADCESF